MVTGNLLRSMKGGSTFINTSRGALVREAEMIEVLSERPDLTAVLDVTDPEPPVAGSPLYILPNVVLTPHIAGSRGAEVRRMADWMLDECGAWLSGHPVRYEVTRENLSRMA
jgi:phosphoglycerate dehydrogenase-like enzyme